MATDTSVPWRIHPQHVHKTAAGGVQSIRRAATIIRILGAYGRVGASVRKVAAASGLHKSTAHRILCALVEEGFLEQEATTRNYRLGAEVFTLGAAMGRDFDIKALAQKSLDRLCQISQDTIYLGVRTYYCGLCLDMREGSSSSKALRLRVDDSWPLGIGAFSMALLAFLPDNEVDAIIKRNARLLLGQRQFTSSLLRRHVDSTRRRGYAVTSNIGQSGLGSVAVPIFDPHQRPIASLCITATVERMVAERQTRLVASAWEESKSITRVWCEARDGFGRNDAWREGLAPGPAAQASLRPH
ncbi:MAG: IclR family transcriptional regulator [Proteobacteria bacterium]|nr:IclR family transcriptional regulator [Pseudomonadota bacterium]